MSTTVTCHKFSEVTDGNFSFFWGYHYFYFTTFVAIYFNFKRIFLQLHVTFDFSLYIQNICGVYAFGCNVWVTSLLLLTLLTNKTHAESFDSLLPVKLSGALGPCMY